MLVKIERLAKEEASRLGLSLMASNHFVDAAYNQYTNRAPEFYGPQYIEARRMGVEWAKTFEPS